MQKAKKQELLIFLIIVGVAAFFRLFQLDVLPLEPHPDEALTKIASTIISILTVIGLYLFVKQLFEWRLAAIASYLLAISFWHVNFSRMGSVAIIIPFTLVYAYYFIWKGLKHNHLPSFIIAGIFGGFICLSSGTSLIPIFYILLSPILAIMLFLNYWWYLKKDFDHAKYEYAKTKLLQGFVLLFLTTFVVTLPIFINFWQHGISLQARPVNQVLPGIIKTLGMFNFSDSPLLPWPIGVFFVVGFINEFIHWLKRKHGHFSTTHTLLFAWFFVMLIPGFLSNQAPNALLTIGVLPIVMTFTARGIWWFFDKLSSWYSLRDPHSIHEAHAITALVMIIFLFSIGFMEYWRYFK